VAGALYLGAAGEVRIVVIAAAVCAALTLGSIEHSRRNWTAPPRRSIALVLLSLLAGAAATGAVLLQAQKDPRHPALVAQGRNYPRIKPAWTDPLGTASKSLARTAAARPHPKLHTGTNTPTSHPAHIRKHTSRSIWLYVAAAIMLFVLVLIALIAARLLYTRFAWRRLRRRLAAGTPVDEVIGAWAWTRMRLEACRLPLALDVSPDVVVAQPGVNEVPEGVYTPLRSLAVTTTKAAFSQEQSLGRAEVAAAWRAAGKTDESARKLMTRRGRARLAFRAPVSAELTD
jgi:hypothetical protein